MTDTPRAACQPAVRGAADDAAVEDHKARAGQRGRIGAEQRRRRAGGVGPSSSTRADLARRGRSQDAAEALAEYSSAAGGQSADRPPVDRAPIETCCNRHMGSNRPIAAQDMPSMANPQIDSISEVLDSRQRHLPRLGTSGAGLTTHQPVRPLLPRFVCRSWRTYEHPHGSPSPGDPLVAAWQSCLPGSRLPKTPSPPSLLAGVISFMTGRGLPASGHRQPVPDARSSRCRHAHSR